MRRQFTRYSVLMLSLLPFAAAKGQTGGVVPGGVVPGDVLRGEAIPGEAMARTWCANCHDVGRATRPSASDAISSFVSIARMPSTTAMSLRVFLLTPHGNMPDYQLGRRELDDVIAYILSLRTE